MIGNVNWINSTARKEEEEEESTKESKKPRSSSERERVNKKKRGIIYPRWALKSALVGRSVGRRSPQLCRPSVSTWRTQHGNLLLKLLIRPRGRRRMTGGSSPPPPIHHRCRRVPHTQQRKQQLSPPVSCWLAFAGARRPPCSTRTRFGYLYKRSDSLRLLSTQLALSSLFATCRVVLPHRIASPIFKEP